MCSLPLHGSTMHHGWQSSHFKYVVQGAFCCVCSKVTMIQLYVDLVKSLQVRRPSNIAQCYLLYAFSDPLMSMDYHCFMNVLLLPKILNYVCVLDTSPCPLIVTAEMNPVVAGTRTVTISDFAIGIYLGKKYDGKFSDVWQLIVLFRVLLWRTLEKIRRLQESNHFQLRCFICWDNS